MLALLYTLSSDNKQQVFVCLAKTIMAAMEIPSHQMVTMVPLPVTRLFLLLEFMISHTSAAPSILLSQVGLHLSGNNASLHYSSSSHMKSVPQVKSNILSDDHRFPCFITESDIEQTYTELSPGKRPMNTVDRTYIISSTCT